MRNRFKILSTIVFIATTLFISCTWQLVSFVPTGKTYTPLENYEEVVVYYTTRPDTSEYYEIGILEVKENNFEDRYQYARRKAASVGGDGIIPLVEHYYTESDLKMVPTEKIILADSLGTKSFIKKSPVIVDKQHISQRFIVIKMKLK